MRKVTLLFPDVLSMTEFILVNRPSKAITDSAGKLFKGIVTDLVLEIACKQYGAKIKESIQTKSFGD